MHDVSGAFIISNTFRVDDLVSPKHDFNDVRRQFLSARKKIDDEHALSSCPTSLDHVLQWRVAHNSAIPIMSAVNRCPRESRWKTATGQNMIRREVIYVAVKDLELRCLNVHGANDQSNRARSQSAEIRVFSEQLADRRRIVETRPIERKLIAPRQREPFWVKEFRRSKKQAHPR